MSLQNDSKGAGAMLVTIHHFPAHVIISMSLSISRNWLCFAVVSPATEEAGGSSSHLQSWNWQILTLGVRGSWDMGKKKKSTSLAKA